MLELDEEREFGPPLTRSDIEAGKREEDNVRCYALRLMASYGWTLDPTEKTCDEDDEGLMMGMRRYIARTLLLCESTPKRLKDEYYLSMF